MSNPILYINGRYLCQWVDFEDIILMLLDSNIMDKTQDDIFAALRDGVVYDWMLERNILNANNFHPNHFINTTDSTVKQYLMRLFGNREEVVNSLNIGEYIELNPSFSIGESNSVVTERGFNGISKIPANTECLIHIKFKVIKAANEEFSINVIGQGNDTPIKLDNFKISTRTKASFVSYELNVKNLVRHNKVTFIVDGNEILSFRLFHGIWLESETKLLPKRPRQITIISNQKDINESNVYTLIKYFLPRGKFIFEGDIMHNIDLDVVKLNEFLTTNYCVGPISMVDINNLTFKQFKKYLVQLLSK